MSEKQNPVTAPIDGMKALATAIRHLPPAHAMYSREKLTRPVTDTFGTHSEKRKLMQGRAEVLGETAQGRIVMFDVINNGNKKVVGIGRTPDGFDPDKGGQKIVGAGRDEVEISPGTFSVMRELKAEQYLMIVQDSDNQKPPSVRYLSTEQLTGISVAPGDKDVQLNPYEFKDAPGHGVHVQIPGTIESVITLE